MLGHRSLSTKGLLAAVLIASAALAGCAEGPSGDEVPTFDGYEEAKQADGTVWQANNTDTPIELKMLYPAGETATTGEHAIVFLLYDSEADEPIENAQFEPQDEYEENCAPAHSFCAEMPEMGHGTSPEESPTHRGDGVYRGMTNFMMSGGWVINIDPMVDGEVLEYDVTLTTEGEGEGDMNMDG